VVPIDANRESLGMKQGLGFDHWLMMEKSRTRRTPKSRLLLDSVSVVDINQPTDIQNFSSPFCPILASPLHILNSLVAELQVFLKRHGILDSGEDGG
jgi:hypothetical protein